jgi:hypothetical protein
VVVVIVSGDSGNGDSDSAVVKVVSHCDSETSLRGSIGF